MVEGKANLPPAETPPETGSESHSRLLKGIIAAIVLGIVIGGWLPDLAVKFSILGEAFLNSLMMIVVPLVMLSMIVGITGLGDIRNLGSIGWRTVLYYLMTTGIAVLIGIIAVNIIRPGKGISPGEEHPEYGYSIGGEEGHTVTLLNEKWDRTAYHEKYVLILMDQDVQGAVESVSENSATVRFWQSGEPGDVFYVTTDDGTRRPVQEIDGRLVIAEPEVSTSGTGVKITLPAASGFYSRERGDVGSTLKEVLVGNEEKGRQGLIPRNIFDAMVRMEMLPLIVFSLLLGATLSVLGERVRTTINVISTLNDAVMQLVHWIMIVAPVGIFGLIAARIGRAGGFSGFMPELLALGKYSFTVLSGLSIHGFIILPIILKLLGRRSPGTYVRGVGPALLNAFSTASSSATLPLTMQGVREENGISNRTASFVLPLGATINMDGTALYESVAAIFIAQVYGIHLGPALQVVIFFTATLAAIGAAGIPEAGLVTMVIVLKAVGLPIEGIGLLLAIDWLLDRFRTTVNVWGDSVGAGVIETLESRSENGGEAPLVA
ncbi:MAG: dicarboxylate/amino acid:cation symporter [Candidatus Glassbacteria bacterium]